MEYSIIYTADPTATETQTLWQGISHHAQMVRGLAPGRSFGFFIHDSSPHIWGGCSGYLFYGCLMVDLLWVDPKLRGQKYGTKLMMAAEELAIQEACRFMTVNTMDFEALDFYKKLGFFVEFERYGFEKNSIFYFLRKDIIL